MNIKFIYSRIQFVNSFLFSPNSYILTQIHTHTHTQNWKNNFHWKINKSYNEWKLFLFFGQQICVYVWTKTMTNGWFFCIVDRVVNKCMCVSDHEIRKLFSLEFMGCEKNEEDFSVCCCFFFSLHEFNFQKKGLFLKKNNHLMMIVLCVVYDECLFVCLFHW